MEGLNNAAAWEEWKSFALAHQPANSIIPLRLHGRLGLQLSCFSGSVADCFFPLHSAKSELCSTELTREPFILCFFQTLDTSKTGSMYLLEANCLQHSAIKTSVSVASTSFSESYLPISPKCFYLFWQKQSCNEKMKLAIFHVKQENDTFFFLLCLNTQFERFVLYIACFFAIYIDSNDLLIFRDRSWKKGENSSVWKLQSVSDITLPLKWQQLLAALLELSDMMFSVAVWLGDEQQNPNTCGQRSHLTTAEPASALSAFSSSAGSYLCKLAAIW